MQRTVRYEILRDEEEAVPAEPVAMATAQPPPLPPAPPIEESTALTAVEPPKDTVQVQMPPPYSVATDLPSYEEAERVKKEEAERQELTPEPSETEGDRFDGMVLGTDGMFLCTFLVAFLFNWIGLLASLCISNTVAGRMGALSGFGLSIVKWVAIVQNQHWVEDVAAADSWLWWILMILGFLIFFRGCVQYVRVKHQWHTLSAIARRRLVIFY